MRNSSSGPRAVKSVNLTGSHRRFKVMLGCSAEVRGKQVRMMFGGEYVCDRCKRPETVRFCTESYYQLDDGREIRVSDEPVWCYQCKCVRSAERLDDPDRLAVSLDRLNASGITDEMRDAAELFEQSPEEVYTERIAYDAARLAWRRARRSPPRCLECGSTNFVALVRGPQGRLDSFSHPSCGGTFQRVSIFHAQLASHRIMNAEGVYLCSR